MSSEDLLDLPYNEQIDIAKDETTPSHVLVRLLQSNNNRVRSTAASNLNLGVETMLSSNYLRPDDATAIYAVARRKDLNPEMVRRLFVWAEENNSTEMMISLANSSVAPVDVLRKLAKSKEVFVLVNVAENERTPLDVLHELADLPGELVRSAVVENCYAPGFLLEYLSFDPSSYVRSKLVRNEHTPVHLLRLIAAGENDSDVRWGIVSRLLNHGDDDGTDGNE